MRPQLPRYMNLMTDYAFKKVYGSPEHKNNLITLLNAALEGKEVITDLEYLDKEQLPFREDHKRVVFDIYCTTSDGSHIIVEMQRTIQPTFSERAIAYCTHAILNQILRGKKYTFSKVYGVYLMDFHLLDHEPKLLRRVTLMDEESHELFSDKMNMVFLDLTSLKRDTLEECENDLERCLFLTKNMEKMKEKPKDYPMFDDLFDAADITHLVNEEVVKYSESRIKLEEDRAGMEYFGQIQRAEGIQEGIKEGIEKGELRMLRNIVNNMLKKGLSIKDISETLGYPDAYLSSLC